MRRQTAEVRTRIVDAAYESFWRLGFRRSSVDAIAARAGLTKRTVYAYFRSKDDLLAAVLQRYEALAEERLERIGERMPADRVGLIDSYFGQLSGWASTTPRWSGSGFTRLVVELADLPGHPARAIARRAKAKSESWLAGRLDGRAREERARARPRDHAVDGGRDGADADPWRARLYRRRGPGSKAVGQAKVEGCIALFWTSDDEI